MLAHERVAGSQRVGEEKGRACAGELAGTKGGEAESDRRVGVAPRSDRERGIESGDREREVLRRNAT